MSEFHRACYQLLDGKVRLVGGLGVFLSFFQAGFVLRKHQKSNLSKVSSETTFFVLSVLSVVSRRKKRGLPLPPSLFLVKEHLAPSGPQKGEKRRR